MMCLGMGDEAMLDETVSQKLTVVKGYSTYVMNGNTARHTLYDEEY